MSTTEHFPVDMPTDHEALKALVGRTAADELLGSGKKSDVKGCWDRIVIMAHHLEADELRQYIFEAEQAIHSSSFWAGRNGDHDAQHAMASAAHFLAVQFCLRHGHTERCAAQAQPYDKAWNRAVEGSGIGPNKVACLCTPDITLETAPSWSVEPTIIEPDPVPQVTLMCRLSGAGHGDMGTVHAATSTAGNRSLCGWIPKGVYNNVWAGPQTDIECARCKRRAEALG